MIIVSLKRKENSFKGGSFFLLQKKKKVQPNCSGLSFLSVKSALTLSYTKLCSCTCGEAVLQLAQFLAYVCELYIVDNRLFLLEVITLLKTL